MIAPGAGSSSGALFRGGSNDTHDDIQEHRGRRRHRRRHPDRDRRQRAVPQRHVRHPDLQLQCHWQRRPEKRALPSLSGQFHRPSPSSNPTIGTSVRLTRSNIPARSISGSGRVSIRTATASRPSPTFSAPGRAHLTIGTGDADRDLDNVRCSTNSAGQGTGDGSAGGKFEPPPSTRSRRGA